MNLFTIFYMDICLSSCLPASDSVLYALHLKTCLEDDGLCGLHPFQHSSTIGLKSAVDVCLEAPALRPLNSKDKECNNGH